MTAFPLRHFIVENKNLAMVLLTFDFWPEPPPASHVAAFLFLFFAEGEEDPRAENDRPKPLPTDQKVIDGLKKLANEDRKKWEMDFNRARRMAGYPAFRKVGFEDIGRLEVDLDDYADGIKWVKDRKEKDWGKYTFRHLNTKKVTGKAAPPRAERKKAVKNSFNSFWFSYRMHVWIQCRNLCDRMSEHIESEYREYQLKAGWKWIIAWVMDLFDMVEC
ncbi:hypothetical protein B0H13DRAFT_1907330 [Mycena leptocephala]|nr:hypothetical protein B0H13DRAFT_1907330 [Mycena leptocephala]